MTVYFADSNAVAKRYVTEVGSNWVKKWADPAHGNIIVLSDIASVEVQRVFVRLRHEKQINIRASTRLRRDFLLHARNQYIVIEVDNSLHQEAVRLIRKHQIFANRVIRSLDAIQLACAIRASHAFGASIPFVTSDTKFISAVQDEGFTVINPEKFP